MMFHYLTYDYHYDVQLYIHQSRTSLLLGIEWYCCCLTPSANYYIWWDS